MRKHSVKKDGARLFLCLCQGDARIYREAVGDIAAPQWWCLSVRKSRALASLAKRAVNGDGKLSKALWAAWVRMGKKQSEAYQSQSELEKSACIGSAQRRHGVKTSGVILSGYICHARSRTAKCQCRSGQGCLSRLLAQPAPGLAVSGVRLGQAHCLAVSVPVRVTAEDCIPPGAASLPVTCKLPLTAAPPLTAKSREAAGTGERGRRDVVSQY